MALKDTLKDNRGLFTTSQEELSSLRQRVTSPQENMVTGGSPDTAKMAGTPAQTKSAIRTAVEGSDYLQDYLRRGGAQAQEGESAAEAGLKASAATISQVGQLSQAIPDIIARRFADVPTTGTLEVIADLDLGEDGDALKNKIMTAPASLTNADFLKIANALEIETTGNFAEEVKSILKIGDATLAEKVASDIAGEIRMSELTTKELSQMGFASVEELADALEIDPEDVGDLSLNQVQNQIESLQADMFDRAAEARDILKDPNSTAAQKSAAKNALARYSQLGIEDVEVQVANIQRQIEKGQTITFNGELTTVEDLLDSSKMEIKVLAALSDPEKMQELKDKEPGLHTLIETHQALFKDLVGKVDEGVQNFIEINDYNAELAKPSEDLDSAFTTDEMNAILGVDDYGTLSDTKYEDNGILEFLKDDTVGSDQKKALQYAIQLSAGKHPELMTQLSGLSSANIKKLGFNNTQTASEYLKNYEAAKNLQKLDLKANPNDLFSTYIGKDSKSVQADLQTILAMTSSGFGKAPAGITAILDADGDGKLDLPLEHVRSRMLASSNTDLKTLLKQGKKISSSTAPGIVGYNINEPTSSVFQQVKKYFTNGTVTASEAREMASSMSGDDLAVLYDSNAPGMNRDANVEILKKIKTDANKRATEHFTHYIQDIKKILPLSLDTSHNPMQVNSPEDIFTYAKQIKDEMKRLAAQGLHNQADGGWERNQYYNNYQDRLKILQAFATELATKMTGAPEDTAWEKSAIRDFSKRLRKL